MIRSLFDIFPLTRAKPIHPAWEKRRNYMGTIIHGPLTRCGFMGRQRNLPTHSFSITPTPINQKCDSPDGVCKRGPVALNHHLLCLDLRFGSWLMRKGRQGEEKARGSKNLKTNHCRPRERCRLQCHTSRLGRGQGMKLTLLALSSIIIALQIHQQLTHPNPTSTTTSYSRTTELTKPQSQAS